MFDQDMFTLTALVLQSSSGDAGDIYSLRSLTGENLNNAHNSTCLLQMEPRIKTYKGRDTRMDIWCNMLQLGTRIHSICLLAIRTRQALELAWGQGNGISLKQ